MQLEEVMEKETYKKAKEILEKYDPDRFKKVEVSMLDGVQAVLTSFDACAPSSCT